MIPHPPTPPLSLFRTRWSSRSRLLPTTTVGRVDRPFLSVVCVCVCVCVCVEVLCVCVCVCVWARAGVFVCVGTIDRPFPCGVRASVRACVQRVGVFR